MMKTLKFLFLLTFVGMGFISCDSDSDEPKYDDEYYAANAMISSNNENYTETTSGGAIHFNVGGGSVVVNVTCGTDWTAENSAPELFTTTLSTSSITIDADQNTVEEEMTGTIILETATEGIIFATISITQSAYGAPEISVETNECSFPALGVLTAELAVEATADWTAEASDGWLTVTSAANILTLTASENADLEERSTKVTLICSDGIRDSYEYVTVTQDARAYVSVSAESIAFDINADSASVTVESNYDWTYIEPTDEWITVTRNDETLTVSVTENEDTEDRSGTFTITAGDEGENVAEVQVCVEQSGLSDYMILTYSLSLANTETSLPLSGTVDCIVYWGDGSEAETVTSGTPSHTYKEAGDYDIKIKGTVTALKSNSISTYNNPLPLSAVKQWGNLGLTSMEDAFFQCRNLVSLPEQTGEAFAKVTSFSYAFNNCRALKELPEDLFEKCSLVTSFSAAFASCQQLTQIPEKLFGGCVNVEVASELFDSCTGLTTIPKGLFDNFQNAIYLDFLFSGCTALKEIPAGLFDNCTAAIGFDYLFSGCSALETIPEGLFDNCPQVDSFSSAFSGCTSLTTIPTGLFANNKSVLVFESTFDGDTALEGESPYDVINGVKVHLYERENYPEVYTAPTQYSYCFYDCTELSDYDDIPTGWVETSGSGGGGGIGGGIIGGGLN